MLRTMQKQYENVEDLFHEALEARKLKLDVDSPQKLESKNNPAVLQHRHQYIWENGRQCAAATTKIAFSSVMTRL